MSGPWGGGSKILSSIVDKAMSRGHWVFFEEEIWSAKFDAIFCVDPRPSHCVSYRDMLVKARKDGCKLIQRIGDLGTHGKPELFELVEQTSTHSDALIFPSEWAKNKLASSNTNSFVVQNAPLREFVEARKSSVDLTKLRVVSHHWSNNSMKGFDVYRDLDNYCSTRADVAFTFIGRKPDEIQLGNHVQPLDVPGLVSELPKHNVYVTASKQEAGANHVLEAMALGLPVLYHRDGGSINEYCATRGIAYDSFDDLMDILENRREELTQLARLAPPTRCTSDAAGVYVDILEGLAP